MWKFVLFGFCNKVLTIYSKGEFAYEQYFRGGSVWELHRVIRLFGILVGLIFRGFFFHPRFVGSLGFGRNIS